jgi:DNA helicase IV
MRALRNVTPTAEQLKIFARTRPGVELIRGAAGSGKTTTALLRLKSLIAYFKNRRLREEDASPLNVLVLTYNRTLRGYIEELTKEQIKNLKGVNLQISTFGKWSKVALNNPRIADGETANSKIVTLGGNLGLSTRFLLSEVEYVLGRFLPSNLDEYTSAARVGRGTSPRMQKQQRVNLLDEVIRPYQKWKAERHWFDWNDLAVELASRKLNTAFDIVVADEAQDFSANQVRAVLNQLAPVHSLTLVLDSAQRIYPRGFTWQEAGVVLRPENVSKLEENYRNTVETARLAASIIDGLPIDDDGSMPNFKSCTRHGPEPIVVRGKFGKQMDFVVDHLRKKIDLNKQSVVFLHPQGGGWFSEVRSRLAGAGLSYVEITRQSEWPQGSQNIALSTLHSAKGLEFDHVIVVGLNAEVTVHGKDEDDDSLLTLRRLLAMGIGRARESVILGYKPSEASRLVDYMDPKSYKAIDV